MTAQQAVYTSAEWGLRPDQDAHTSLPAIKQDIVRALHTIALYSNTLITLRTLSCSSLGISLLADCRMASAILNKN